MKEKYHKHPPLVKPIRGKYHRNEWAIYGTTCDRIESFFEKLDARLSSQYHLTYVDADHHVDQEKTEFQIGKKQFSQSIPLTWNEYDDRLQSWHTDAVFVNGNHYPADRQIVFIDPKKKESLQRRVEQLTQIDVIIKLDDTAIYDFVNEKIHNETLIIQANDNDSLDAFIKEKIVANKAPLKALILAGGKSKRMGEDKSQIDYYGKAQEIYIADICAHLGLETFISKSHTHIENTISDYPVIKDRLVEMGPFGAILSAMMSDPNASWLVIACDLPYITKDSILDLINSRKTSKHATAYKLIGQPFPEPLIAIYEPSIYQRMLRFMSLGYACPRKVLINSDVEHVKLLKAQIAFNANTAEEKNIVKKSINH